MRLFLLFFLLLTSDVLAQIRITDVPSRIGSIMTNNPAGTDVSSAGNTFQVTTDSIFIAHVTGNTLQAVSYNGISGGDESLAIYGLLDGGFVVRENVVNFSIYDSFGALITSISNSSNSEEGESISELAMDPNGKTIVFYTATIIQSGKKGSVARVVQGNKAVGFYYDDAREISTVEVSQNGELIGIINHRDGEDYQVQIFDRFGNEISTISFDREIKGVTFSDNGLNATVFSSGRVGVYTLKNANRIASTSFRGGNLIRAAFFPEENTIVGVLGDMNENRVQDMKIRAVNIKSRTIKEQPYREALMYSPVVDIMLVRDRAYSYRINGFSRELSIDITF
ncbi:MAG: hypothetical protein AAFW89_10295 [Bacteroidota bacterium]